MSVALYDYQIEAVKKMKNGCILCGGVGSGKSLTALSYYYLKGFYDDRKDQAWSFMHGEDYGWTDIRLPDLYIITTAQKRDKLEWEGELGAFLLSTHPEVNLHRNKVVVDSWNNIGKYKDVAGAFFIFDEQRLIGSGAWVKSFLRIAKANEWILLSATPGDVWQDYIPVFVANGFFKNRSEFLREHVIFSRFAKYPKVDRYVNTGRLIRLRNAVLVPMDYQRPTVAHHVDVAVEYPVGAYKAITRTRWDPYKNEPVVNAAGLCYLWRKVVNSDESRLAALLDIFERHPRVIIFYNFDYELELLKNCRYGDDVEVAEWNGHKHQPIPSCDRWVYLVQYTAGCEGWNCIKTDTIVFYSQNYSYKVMTQAAGRIDRLNTLYTDLYYYYLKSKAPIDLAIAKALAGKKNFVEGRFAGW